RHGERGGHARIVQGAGGGAGALRPPDARRAARMGLDRGGARPRGDHRRRGGAAPPAGGTAAKTTLPVLRLPLESASLKGMDSLLSTVQMPGGIPVATFAIGKPGAVNAGLFAVAILAVKDARLRQALNRYREEQSRKVLEVGDPRGGARKP